MKFQHNLYYIVLGTLLFASSNSFAQKKLEEEIDVVRPYKPVLGDAIKIRKNPDFNDENTTKPVLQYTQFDRQFTQNTNTSKVNAQQLPSEGNAILPLFNARLGGGNNSAILGEFFFNSAQSPTEHYGFYYQAYTAKGEIENQNYSRNNVGLFGKFINESFTTTGSLNYKQNNNYYYGYDHSQVSYDKSDVLHKLNNFNGEVELASNIDPVKTLTYAVKLGGYAFSDNYSAKENNVYLNTLLGNDFGNFGGHVALNLDMNNYQDAAKFKNHFFRLNPYVTLSKERLQSKLGLNFVSNFGDNSSFKIYPNIYAEYQAIDKYLSFFGGLNGDLQKNTLKDLSVKNPFLGNDIVLKNSNERLKVFAGLKGTIITGLGFKVQFTSSSIDSLPFFVNKLLPSTGSEVNISERYNVVYSGKKSNMTTLSANLEYAASERLRLGMDILTNSYDLNGVDKPWLTPNYRVTLSGTYQAMKDLSFTADLFNVGKQYALIDPSVNSYQTLSGYTDLNLGMNYRFHKNFGAFANINNILGKKYDLYLNYPSYGFNFIAGISVTF
ncbi:TonB-dependent receptor [Solitalea sp. MAHUQ-68]|uniref:TonB-dependent receptor n=1 Tax=Solitalea agri TaxID=2953739 RepID=A0A9X2EZH7_9SPHI|nr:TonB-dependent receptor [Solitalea agri]MCO4291917.1 TonB-dependent receptor [Solitalea agri]